MLSQNTCVSHHIRKTPLTGGSRIGLLDRNISSTGVSSLSVGWIKLHVRPLRLFKLVQTPVCFQLFSEPVLCNCQHFTKRIDEKRKKCQLFIEKELCLTGIKSNTLTMGGCSFSTLGKHPTHPFCLAIRIFLGRSSKIDEKPSHRDRQKCE